MPHAQACVVYILRVAVIRQLAERSQRKLLDRLVAIAAGGIAPPLVIAALEGMGALIEVLGEVPPEAAAAVEQVRLGPAWFRGAALHAMRSRVACMQLCKRRS
jgi:hypothetical protein